MSNSKHSRRSFLHTTVAGSTALGLAGATAEAADSDTGIPTRPLGKTGVRVSILCLGGWHIGSVKDEKEAIRIMHTAIDEGLTFFDNAWDYHDGGSEVIMGKALADPAKRRKVFLMSKNCARDGRGTRLHLEESLKRFQTDVIDLWQFHEINYDNDPDWVFERGAMAEALKAQKEGKIRFIGFTGHKSPHIHLSMLPRHPWDTVQMPMNLCDYHYRSFVKQVVPEANKRGIACIGMKSLGGANQMGTFIANKLCTAEEARRYALSQDIASLVVGIDSMDILKQDLAMARNFKKLTDDELARLTSRVKVMAGDGRLERFKSTQAFDGEYHRKQHGLG